MSRPRSGRAASGAAASRAPSRVLVQTPRSDIYVALLGIALGAMILGCLLLLLILNEYGFQTKVSQLGPGGPSPVAIARADATAAHPAEISSGIRL